MDEKRYLSITESGTIILFLFLKKFYHEILSIAARAFRLAAMICCGNLVTSAQQAVVPLEFCGFIEY